MTRFANAGIGFVLAIVVFILGLLMALGVFTATPEHVGFTFMLIAGAVLL